MCPLLAGKAEREGEIKQDSTDSDFSAATLWIFIKSGVRELRWHLLRCRGQDEHPCAREGCMELSPALEYIHGGRPIATQNLGALYPQRAVLVPGKLLCSGTAPPHLSFLQGPSTRTTTTDWEQLSEARAPLWWLSVQPCPAQ